MESETEVESFHCNIEIGTQSDQAILRRQKLVVRASMLSMDERRGESSRTMSSTGPRQLRKAGAQYRTRFIRSAHGCKVLSSIASRSMNGHPWKKVADYLHSAIALGKCRTLVSGHGRIAEPSLDGRNQQEDQFGEMCDQSLGSGGWRLPVVACRIDEPAIRALCSD